MKKIIISLFVLLSVSVIPLTAQSRNSNEIYLGYGYPKTVGTSLIGGFTEIFSTIFTGGQAGMKTTGPGVAQIGYNRYLTDNIAVGGIFTFEPFTMTSNSGDNVNVSKNGLFSIQGTFKYQYGWEWVRLYHGISMGVGINAFFDGGSPSAMFIMNLIPIGVKVGKDEGFNFFLDMGLWSTALINAGASFSF